MFHFPIPPQYIQQVSVCQEAKAAAPWINLFVLPEFDSPNMSGSATAEPCLPEDDAATPRSGRTAFPASASENMQADAPGRVRGRKIQGWNPQRAIAHLRRHASVIKSHCRCAEYVANAIDAGGVRLNRDLNLTPRNSACGYGDVLQAAGFNPLPPDTEPQAGDVVVIQPVKGHPDGHMAMFDGQVWYSDFRQSKGMYPNDAERIQRPPYTLYRHS